MNRKINGHSAEYLKRQAKNIKKAQGITYLAALDQAAIVAGFTGWDNFINETNVTERRKSIAQSHLGTTVAGIDVSGRGTSVKMNPYRKLLIAAINSLLAHGLISLNGSDDDHEKRENGHVLTEIFGYPTQIMWSDIGFQELRISV